MTQKKQPRTAIKIGNARCANTANVSTPGCRTMKQYEAVMRWHELHPSVHWSGNPFEPHPNGKVYKSTFRHTYFGVDGHIHHLHVTPTGQITESPVITEHNFRTGPFGTDATIEQYGVFAG